MIKCISTKIKNNLIWVLVIFSIVVNVIYWNIIATDRYVSEANVVLESPQLSANSFNFQSILTGGNGAGKSDMLILREYLLSVDMLKKLLDSHGFESHYSQDNIDHFSRLSRGQPLEKIYDYYLNIVQVDLDEYANVLRIKVRGFDAEYTKDLLGFLLVEGERKMNDMGRRLAEEQVSFLEKQVDKLYEKLESARKSITEYQNKNGMFSPVVTVESLSSIVSGLEAEVASLNAKRNALLNYQSDKSAEVIKVESEIRALNSQIKKEQARITAENGNALNTNSSEFQTLQLKLKFAQESYSTGLAALESTRIEAARKLKQLSILQSPTKPEYPSEPRRGYTTLVSILLSIVIGFICHMVILIIRDHRD
jgi:capsular polysaccharide transport system permease protein